jgi:hypothetical protein
LGLLPEQFWSLTFFEYASYSKSFMEEDKRQWNHTASMMALHANMNRDPKRTPRPYTADSFIPYKDQRKKAKFVHSMTPEQKDLTATWAKNFQDGRKTDK